METRCDICPNGCLIAEDHTGICHGRANRGGTIVCENYGLITSLALDPIEKKPLSHFHPGKMILSVGSYGCNLRCPFCQNSSISTAKRDDFEHLEHIEPADLVAQAEKLVPRGNIGIAFTYNEPSISFEYVRDTARLAKDAGLATVSVTNGYINPEPFAVLCDCIDAMNIDLKAFDEDFYQMCGGHLEPVLANIAAAHAAGVHVELTTLVIPGLNDTDEEMEREAAWIASLSPEIPLHITRFFPRYKMSDRHATDPASLYRLAGIAGMKLSRVHVGNV